MGQAEIRRRMDLFRESGILHGSRQDRIHAGSDEFELYGKNYNERVKRQKRPWHQLWHYHQGKKGRGLHYRSRREERQHNLGQAEIRRRIYQPGLYRKSVGGNGDIMKNYIGVKIVKAEPKEKNGVPGYAVKYPDGYVSWSPKETFEKAYRELDCQDFINSAK